MIKFIIDLIKLTGILCSCIYIITNYNLMTLVCILILIKWDKP